MKSVVTYVVAGALALSTQACKNPSTGSSDAKTNQSATPPVPVDQNAMAHPALVSGTFSDPATGNFVIFKAEVALRKPIIPLDFNVLAEGEGVKTVMLEAVKDTCSDEICTFTNKTEAVTITFAASNATNEYLVQAVTWHSQTVDPATLRFRTQKNPNDVACDLFSGTGC